MGNYQNSNVMDTQMQDTLRDDFQYQGEGGGSTVWRFPQLRGGNKSGKEKSNKPLLIEEYRIEMPQKRSVRAHLRERIPELRQAIRRACVRRSRDKQKMLTGFVSVGDYRRPRRFGIENHGTCRFCYEKV